MASPSRRGMRSTSSTPVSRWKNGSQFRYGIRPTRSMSAPHLDHVVESVALHRDLARVADDPKNLLGGEAGRAGRLGHVGDLLVLEGTVDIGRSEVERQRRGGLAEHHPVRLDMLEVV